MKYLGIDFGEKRVGLALSDEDAFLAFPHDIYPNNPDLVYEISKLINDENVAECVIGESVDQFGLDNKIMKAIKIFAEKLHQETGIKVHYQKEVFTSLHARGGKDKSGNSAKKVKKQSAGPIDASAAALILQRYLDRVKFLNK